MGGSGKNKIRRCRFIRHYYKGRNIKKGWKRVIKKGWERKIKKGWKRGIKKGWKREIKKGWKREIKKGWKRKVKTNKLRACSDLHQNQNHLEPGLPTQLLREEEVLSCMSLQYRAGIGNESRTLEFKSGQGRYLECFLYRDVCIYGCAFLNSGGGTLLVGVRDNGTVCGIILNQTMEDQVRLQVDNAVKTFSPPLLPQNYTLNIMPVIHPRDMPNQLRVLRLTFRLPQVLHEPLLFCVGLNEEMYLRRDGSVQGPLSLSVILQLQKEKWSQYLQRIVQENMVLLEQMKMLQEVFLAARKSQIPKKDPPIS